MHQAAYSSERPRLTLKRVAAASRCSRRSRRNEAKGVSLRAAAGPDRSHALYSWCLFTYVGCACCARLSAVRRFSSARFLSFSVRARRSFMNVAQLSSGLPSSRAGDTASHSMYSRSRASEAVLAILPVAVRFNVTDDGTAGACTTLGAFAIARVNGIECRRLEPKVRGAQKATTRFYE